MNQIKQLSQKKLLGLCAAAIVIGAGAWMLLSPSGPSTKAGRTFLQEQQDKDPTQIKAQIEAAQRDEINNQLAQGTMDIFDAYTDFVFLGDSRTEGFSGYGFFSPANVLADKGNTIMTIPDRVEAVAAMKPKNIIISYGANDVESQIGEGAAGPGYDVVFEQNVKQLLEADPGANIYICSIIPTTAEAAAAEPLLEAIPQYNEKIKAMCERNGWTYIDCTSLASPDIFEPDGIHFVAGFYPRWAEHIYPYVYGSSQGGQS